MIVGSIADDMMCISRKPEPKNKRAKSKLILT